MKTSTSVPSERPSVVKPTRLGVVPRSAGRRVRRASMDENAEELLDADAAIEPCLVGWSEKAEDGVEVYCCEQPGGGKECRTVTSEHTECVLVEDEQGELTVSCDQDVVKAAKEAEETKA